MPYCYTFDLDAPPPPPRYATLPRLDSAPSGTSATPKGRKADTRPNVPIPIVRMLLTQLAVALAEIPGAVDTLRTAVDRIWPILVPAEP